MRTEKESSPQISGDMVSFHNMVSPQNGDTRGGAPRSPPPLATPLLYLWYVYKYLATGKYNVIKNQTLFCWRPWFKKLAATAPPPLLFYKPLWSFFYSWKYKKTVKTQTSFNGRNFSRACYFILVIAFWRRTALQFSILRYVVLILPIFYTK